MAAITAATVTGDNRWGGKVSIQEGRKRNAVQIAFGDGASTYPANGIPIGPIGRFGLVRFLERLQLDSPSPGDGSVYKWDSVNNSIRIFTAGTELTTAATPALTTLYATAVGW